MLSFFFPLYFCKMKGFIQVFFFITITFLFHSCDSTSRKAKEPKDFIPKNTSLVIKIEDFEVLKADIKNNSFIEKLKNTNSYSFFSNSRLLNLLRPSKKSILCFSEDDDRSSFTFLTKFTKNLFILDSVTNMVTENIPFKSYQYQKFVIDKQEFFTVVKDSIFIATDSQKNIEQLLNNRIQNESTFKKIFSLNNHNLTTIIPVKKIFTNEPSINNFASWAALNIEVLPDAISASGVLLANDTIPQLISIFKGLKPQQNDIATITPTNAMSVISLTFDDFSIFQKNLQKYSGAENISTDKTMVFESVSEFSSIKLPQGIAIALKSIDLELTKESLSKYSSPVESFKGITIYNFIERNLFVDQFSIFANDTKPVFNIIVNDFIVFAENKEVLKNIITSYLTNNCLSTTNYYQEALDQISDESSLLIIKLNQNYTHTISRLLNDSLKNISFKKYPIGVLQFNYDRDFAHINLVCKESNTTSIKKNIPGKVTQVKSILLENELLNDPIFFSNHRTGGKDLVVQDVDNTLYFISSKGKILWTKKLKNRIVGSVQEIDLLRNGKKQLAFTTKKNFYVLDRTGRQVDPFPIKFKDDITQALTVFDYDKNRKYRFIITQGKEVLMLNSEGKKVKGFKFNKSISEIIFPPQHFRIAGKDYITIAEKNGQLNILSRVGKPRILAPKTFDFSNTPISLENTKLVVIEKDNTKNSINIDGKITSRKLEVTSYQFVIKGKTKVTLDDNLMRINGILVELPYGIYTKPSISIVNQKEYISITETQENKIYVYSKSGNLLHGFPVYGTSTPDFGDMTKSGKTNFVTKGESKEILIYELK